MVVPAGTFLLEMECLAMMSHEAGVWGVFLGLLKLCVWWGAEAVGLKREGALHHCRI